MSIAVKRLNAKFLDHLEKSDYLRNSISFGSSLESELDTETADKAYGSSENRAENHRKSAKTLYKEIDMIKDAAKAAYDKRSYYLIIGFLVLLISKVVEAYTP